MSRVNLLEVSNLKVTFSAGLQAVKGVDFFVRQGECLGIVGESGSGKSVSVSAVLGLLSKEAKVQGTAHWNGQDLLQLSRNGLREIRGSQIGMIFQETSRSFDPLYTIEKTFYETFQTVDPKISRNTSAKKACELLNEVGILEPERRLKNFPHQFSGGMLQRIMIALALANNPQLLIADEPTTALDVTIQAQIIDLLKLEQEKRGLSLIFISHNLGVVSEIAQRVQVMYAGLIMETGAVESVLEQPLCPYTKALLDSLPTWGSHYTQKKLRSIPGSIPDQTEPGPGCPFESRCTQTKKICKEQLPNLQGSENRSFRCFFKGDEFV